MASHNTQERTLRGTEIISGTRAISFLEIPFLYDYRPQSPQERGNIAPIYRRDVTRCLHC